ncbi:MAG TPA: hypothetical protein VMT63_06160 [Bacteroidales bacterium]|nr:hypothetical protein [Bacteroidales bacterium]
MKNNRINIIFLTLLHLAIFLYPVGIKAFHRHHTHDKHFSVSDSPSINNPEDNCAICQFEYVNFLVKAHTGLSPASNSHIVSQPGTEFILRPESFDYFQYRAPPVNFL